MAIAPSKLGRFVDRDWSSESALVRGLREVGLVKPDVSDDKLLAVFRMAREEHEAIPEDGGREFNSPNERIRVFLNPYLTKKGRQWAVPLTSLDLPDEPPAESQ